MPAYTTEETTSLTLDDLKRLAANTGPCITVLMPLHAGDKRQNPLQLRAAIQKVSEMLKARGLDDASIGELVKPLDELKDDLERGSGSLAILRSVETFRVFHINRELEEHVAVGNNFYVRPLVEEVKENKIFYILALSQNNVRLLRCTDQMSEVVPLPEWVPTNLMDHAQTDKPDHNLKNMQAVSQRGDMKGVKSATNTEAESKDEYLSHFYKTVSDGVQEVLKNENSPLVIAGVEYEQPLYRDVNQYNYLVEEGVRGAPDGLKGPELHKRALEIVTPHFDSSLDRALQIFERQGGTERTSTSLKDIVKAAFETRVAHLFLADTARPVMGNFDEATHRVRAANQPDVGDEDLVNAAIVHTLVYGGRVHIMPQDRIPQNSPQAAIFRF